MQNNDMIWKLVKYCEAPTYMSKKHQENWVRTNKEIDNGRFPHDKSLRKKT